eukprot:scaffold38171_cov50-Phaeocystis_antarctica.AAC.6
MTLDVSRLSGRLNAYAFCRVQREAYRESDMEGQETGGRWGGSPKHGHGGAHVKHAPHVCDAGRVKTQRLVERRRRLPSQKEGMLRGRHAGRDRGLAGGSCASSMQGGAN